MFCVCILDLHYFIVCFLSLPQKPAINGLPPTPKVLVSESYVLSLTSSRWPGFMDTVIKLVWAAAAVHSVDIWGPQSFLLCGFFCSAQLQIIKPWLTFSASLSQRLPVLSHAAFHFRWEPVSLKCLMAAHWRLTVPHHGFIQTPKVKLHALNTVQNWHVFLKPVLHFISLFPSRSVSDLWDRGWHLYAESKWATWSYNGAGTSS